MIEDPGNWHVTSPNPAITPISPWPDRYTIMLIRSVRGSRYPAAAIVAGAANCWRQTVWQNRSIHPGCADCYPPSVQQN